MNKQQTSVNKERKKERKKEMKKSLEKQEEEFLHSIKKKKRKMKINTELNCWRKCSIKYPSNEKKKNKNKDKKRKEKKNARPLFWHFAGNFFFHKKRASKLLLCASILGVVLDNTVNYFPQGHISRIYMYIYSKPYQIMIHDVLLYSFFFFF